MIRMNWIQKPPHPKLVKFIPNSHCQNQQKRAATMRPRKFTCCCNLIEAKRWAEQHSTRRYKDMVIWEGLLQEYPSCHHRLPSCSLRSLAYLVLWISLGVVCRLFIKRIWSRNMFLKDHHVCNELSSNSRIFEHGDIM